MDDWNQLFHWINNGHGKYSLTRSSYNHRNVYDWSYTSSKLQISTGITDLYIYATMPCVLHTLFRQACNENILMAQFQFCAMKRGRQVCCPEQRWPYVSRMLRYGENTLSREHKQVSIFFLHSLANTIVNWARNISN